MTVLDASNLLYEWFRSHDSFEINKDLKKLFPIVEDEETINVVLKLALAQLEQSNLITSQIYNEKKIYVLVKSFESYQQNVEISPWTSRWVAEQINDFCNLISDKTDLCTAAQINDKDVRNLVHIIRFYKTKLTEKESIISKLSSGCSLEDILKNINNNNDDDNDDKDDDDGDDKKENKKKK